MIINGNWIVTPQEGFAGLIQNMPKAANAAADGIEAGSNVSWLFCNVLQQVDVRGGIVRDEIAQLPSYSGHRAVVEEESVII